MELKILTSDKTYLKSRHTINSLIRNVDLVFEGPFCSYSPYSKWWYNTVANRFVTLLANLTYCVSVNSVSRSFLLSYLCLLELWATLDVCPRVHFPVLIPPANTQSPVLSCSPVPTISFHSTPRREFDPNRSTTDPGGSQK